MAQIVGKYEHVSSAPNFDDYLRTLGASEEIVKNVVQMKPTITISESGDKWTITVTKNGTDFTSTFKLGEVYDEPVGPGAFCKSVTRRDGNTLTTESTLPDGGKEIKFHEFTANGINVENRLPDGNGLQDFVARNEKADKKLDNPARPESAENVRSDLEPEDKKEKELTESNCDSGSDSEDSCIEELSGSSNKDSETTDALEVVETLEEKT